MRAGKGLQVHAQVAARLIAGCLNFVDPFDRLRERASGNVAIEFRFHRMRDGFVQPVDDGLGEPVAGFTDQLHLERASFGVLIRRVREHCSFETEIDHSEIGAIGQMKHAAGIVQVIGVQQPMMVDRRLDSFALGAKLWRGVDGDIEPAHAAQREAVEGDINPMRDHRG